MSDIDFLLHLTAAWLVVVIVARAAGLAARRLGQPTVVGEMVAGIMLGPSLLGALAPQISAYLFEPTKQTLYAIGMIGLCFYMFLVGAEHSGEAPVLRSNHGLPASLGVLGVVVPMVFGGIAAWPLQNAFKPEGVSSLAFLVFMGGALAVTAFPMLARFLQERRMVHTRLGIITTRAAAIDDALAWCVLAFVSALVKGNGFSGILSTVIPAVGFAVIAMLLLPRILRGAAARAVRAGHLSDPLLTMLIALVLGAGWFTDKIGIYSVFGGFMIGLSLPRQRGFYPILERDILPLVRCLLLPIFFAYSGLNTDLRSVKLEYLATTAFLLIIAFLSKALVGIGITRVVGWSWREAIAVGTLMNARGLMILIFINGGLALGIVRTDLFSVLVVIAVLTTALVAPLYRLCISPDDETVARIELQNPQTR